MPEVPERIATLLKLGDRQETLTLENFIKIIQELEALDPDASMEDLLQAVMKSGLQKEVFDLTFIPFFRYPSGELKLNAAVTNVLSDLSVGNQLNKWKNISYPLDPRHRANLGHALTRLDCFKRSGRVKSFLYSYLGDSLKWIHKTILPGSAPKPEEPGGLSPGDWKGNSLGGDLIDTLNCLEAREHSEANSRPKLSDILAAALAASCAPNMESPAGGIVGSSDPMVGLDAGIGGYAQDDDGLLQPSQPAGCTETSPADLAPDACVPSQSSIQTPNSIIDILPRDHSDDAPSSLSAHDLIRTSATPTKTDSLDDFAPTPLKDMSCLDGLLKDGFSFHGAVADETSECQDNGGLFFAFEPAQCLTPQNDETPSGYIPNEQPVCHDGLCCDDVDFFFDHQSIQSVFTPDADPGFSLGMPPQDFSDNSYDQPDEPNPPLSSPNTPQNDNPFEPPPSWMGTPNR
jgi:hypothetical protein